MGITKETDRKVTLIVKHTVALVVAALEGEDTKCLSYLSAELLIKEAEMEGIKPSNLARTISEVLKEREKEVGA